MNPEPDNDPRFEELLEYLNKSRACDFTGYKRASLMRRVHKRMGEVGVTGFEAYQDYLDVHSQEFAALFNTILINVTSFFRDPEAWEYLADVIVPQILASKTADSSIRIWSAGCATGEEAYSLAMILAEALGLEACCRQVNIYATDLDGQDLEQARQASYSADAVAAVPEPLREKYFDAASSNGRCVFSQDLRRILIFDRHNLIHDAPITCLDLLMCRNTLIYFNREAQERIISRFHVALKDSGFCFLGRAETMLMHTGLFEPENMKHPIFRKISIGRSQRRAEPLLQTVEGIHVEESGFDIEL
jgi:two-component system CheB/CheR fusion protein